MIDRLDNPKDFPGYLIWQAGKDWHRQLDSLLSSFDLTYIQFLVLINLDYLLKRKKYVSQKDIVEMMDDLRLRNLLEDELIRMIQDPNLCF